MKIEVDEIKSKVSLLLKASDNGLTDIVEYLIEARADLNAKDGKGWNALMRGISIILSENFVLVALKTFEFIQKLLNVKFSSTV